MFNSVNIEFMQLEAILIIINQHILINKNHWLLNYETVTINNVNNNHENAEIQKRSENALISQVYILNTLRDREDEIKEFIRDGKNSSSVVDNCHSNKTIAIIEQIM